MFRALIYTDTEPGNSVRGTSGFGFQAESPGVTPAEEQQMSLHLLHEVSRRLSTANPPAPVEQHPESFAYLAADERYYLARGRYLGRELGGTRGGNQVTMALVTDEGDDVASARPAQLYAAEAWSLEAAPTPVLDEVEAPLAFSIDFEEPALQELVRTAPDPVRFFSVLVTAVLAASEPEGRQRLVLLCRDTATTARWLAAATVVISDARARALSFRFPVAVPTEHVHRVVGVNPDAVEGSVGTGSYSGRLVIDLDEFTHSDIPISTLAERCARWFLENDPYDAIDATRLATVWGADAPDTAVALAALAALELPPEGPEAAAALARGALAVLRGVERESFLDWSTPVVEGLARVVPATADAVSAYADLAAELRRQLGGQESGTRLVRQLSVAMLDGCSRHPESIVAWARSWSAARMMPLTTSTPGAGTAANVVDPDSARLTAAFSELLTRADSGTIEAALTVAWRLPGVVPLQDAAAGVRTMAERWFRSPEADAGRDERLFDTETVDMLLDHLEAALVAGDAAVRTQFANGQRDALLDRERERLDPASALGSQLLRRDLQRTDPAERIALVARYAMTSPRANWTALIGVASDRAICSLLASWVGAHPSVLGDPDFAEFTARALAENDSPDRSILGARLTPGASRLLLEIGRSRLALPDPLAAIRDDLLRGHQSIGAIARRNSPDAFTRHDRQVLESLRPSTLICLRGRLAEAVLTGRPSKDLLAFLESTPAFDTATLRTEFVNQLGDYSVQSTAAALDFAAVRTGKRVRSAAQAALLDYCASLDKPRRDAMSEGVHAYDESLGKAWDEIMRRVAHAEKPSARLLNSIGNRLNDSSRRKQKD